MLVRIYAGAVWRWCNLVDVGTCPANIEAVAQTANIPLAAASLALERLGEVILAGYVHPATWEVIPPDKLPADVVVIDVSRYGDPVFETEDGVWEPFYCSLEQED